MNIKWNTKKNRGKFKYKSSRGNSLEGVITKIDSKESRIVIEKNDFSSKSYTKIIFRKNVKGLNTNQLANIVFSYYDPGDSIWTRIKHHSNTSGANLPSNAQDHYNGAIPNCSGSTLDYPTKTKYIGDFNEKCSGSTLVKTYYKYKVV